MTTVADLLARAVEKIYPSKEELEKALSKKLKVYQGFDPTSPKLHIGHLIGLRKLAQWQKLGHEVIFLIGDYTATVGDPTGKDTARVPMTHEEVLENAKTYEKQASKILKFNGENPVKIMFNSQWLGKLSASDLLKLAGNMTHGQLIERDMFQKRIKNNKDIYLSELLYPLMQAYDSLNMNIDVEVGGTDQTFNMLMGRKLMRNVSKKEKYVMTLPLLTIGEKKMGKSEGNAIYIDDEPSDLFAKIMALGDEVIVKGFEYLTDIPMDEVGQIEEDLKGGKNPISYKKMLAFEIVKQLNSHDAAHKAQQDFEKVVQNKQISDNIQTIIIDSKTNINAPSLVAMNLVDSISKAKELFNQKGVRLNGITLTPKMKYQIITNGSILEVGRKKFKLIY